MDCKITENYLREKERMCASTNLCKKCGLCEKGNENSACPCAHFQKEYPTKAIAIVQAWSDAHPQRTYLSDFLEKHPNAPLSQTGRPGFCAADLGYRDRKCSGIYCGDCWNTPMEDKP